MGKGPEPAQFFIYLFFYSWILYLQHETEEHANAKLPFVPDSTKAAGEKEKNQSNEVGSTRDCKEKEQINNLRYKLQ